MSNKKQVHVGWDSREELAYDVLKYSIEKHSSNVEVHPIVQPELRRKGLYTRDYDPYSSTEFSLTRFFVPYLMKYSGWAVFMDCDFFSTSNIEDLFKLANPAKAVQVVKHSHYPVGATKMDNQTQTTYPRKNWSSCMLFNCGHRKNKNLTPGVINEVEPSFLHRFEWLDEEDIGELPLTWNFLVEYYKPWPKDKLPRLLHFTSGMPFMSGYENCDYSEEWYKCRNEWEANKD